MVEIKVTPEAVTLIFIILKIASIISWSWWWVFSPMLIVYGLIAFLWLTAGFIDGLKH